MFVEKNIAEYYDTTQTHYEKWWSLNKYLSLHYGIWDNSTKSFGDSIINTNKVLLRSSNISASDKVLDAGCGVGGAAFFIHKQANASVTGISLSQKQISKAKAIAEKNNLKGKVDFYIMDYAHTTFPSESFDVVWACESVSSAANKIDFIAECFRLLKKGGRLIMCDFFLNNEAQVDKHRWMDKWKETWAVPDFVSADFFKINLQKTGFNTIENWDYTQNIKRSARRMYYAALWGAIPSEIYNLFYPNISKFAKNHYKCGYYQYKALQENLWKYNMILAIK